MFGLFSSNKPPKGYKYPKRSKSYKKAFAKAITIKDPLKADRFMRKNKRLLGL